MSNANNHGVIGHHNYPKRGEIKVTSPNNTTGCEILDKLGISAGQAESGYGICLNCELPECSLKEKDDKKKNRR